MNRTLRAMVLLALIVLTAACSKNEERRISDSSAAEMLGNSVRDAGNTLAVGAEATIDEAESLGQETIEEASAVIDEMKNGAEEMVSEAETRAKAWKADATNSREAIEDALELGE